jgi:hypothetical protein
MKPDISAWHGWLIELCDMLFANSVYFWFDFDIYHLATAIYSHSVTGISGPSIEKGYYRSQASDGLSTPIRALSATGHPVVERTTD